MRTVIFLACITLLATGCATEPGSGANKVLTDFGIRQQSDSYHPTTEKVQKGLLDVGPTELKRLNERERQGQIKFQENGLHGQYYKEVKVFEDFTPLDARPMSESSNTRERGFAGYVQYNYQIYQSARRPSRTEAAAEVADIPTGETGKVVFRYKFNAGGVWDGNPGSGSGSRE